MGRRRTRGWGGERDRGGKERGRKREEEAEERKRKRRRRRKRKRRGGGGGEEKEGEAFLIVPECNFRVLEFRMRVLEWKGSSVYCLVGLFVPKSECPFYRLARNCARNTCFFNMKFKSLELTCSHAEASHPSLPTAEHFLDF